MFTSRSRSLWLSPRSAGSLARLRRCFAVRLVATVIAGLMFGGSAPQVWAFPADRPGPWLPATGPMPWKPASPPPRPIAAKSPPARTLVPTRLTPVALERIDAAGAPLRTGAADDPWLAFDRDPSTALVSRDGQPVRLRASFHAARKLTGVLLQGQGGGTLSLFERRPCGAQANRGFDRPGGRTGPVERLAAVLDPHGRRGGGVPARVAAGGAGRSSDRGRPDGTGRPRARGGRTAGRCPARARSRRGGGGPGQPGAGDGLAAGSRGLRQRRPVHAEPRPRSAIDWPRFPGLPAGRRGPLERRSPDGERVPPPRR